MNKLFVIPAYGDSGKEHYYSDILVNIRKKYQIKILDLQIKRGKLLSQLVDEAVTTVGKEKNASMLGFSIGALISYLVSTRVSLKKAILCSVSPYLDKDLLALGARFEKHLGKRLALDVKKIKYSPIKANDVSILYGEKEHPLVVKRSKYIFLKALSKNKKIISIKNTGHEMTREYIDVIRKEL